MQPDSKKSTLSEEASWPLYRVQSSPLTLFGMWVHRHMLPLCYVWMRTSREDNELDKLLCTTEK